MRLETERRMVREMEAVEMEPIDSRIGFVNVAKDDSAHYEIVFCAAVSFNKPYSSQQV